MINTQIPSKYPFLIVLTISSLLLFTNTLVGQPTGNKTYDYANFTVEQSFYTSTSSNEFTASPESEAIWVYSSLPSIKILKRKIFSSIEIDILNRNIFLNSKRINEGVFNRYGISIGTSIINNNRHKSGLFISGGIATDFPTVEKGSEYFHLIYNHKVHISPKLAIGLGLLLSYNAGSWKDPYFINLLPILRWSLTSNLDLNINWDNIQFRKTLSNQIVGVLEARYDMSFFKTSNSFSCYFEEVGIGGGLDVRITKSIYMRLRYKEIIYSNKYIKNSDFNYKLNELNGRSIKLSIVNIK